MATLPGLAVSPAWKERKKVRLVTGKTTSESVDASAPIYYLVFQVGSHLLIFFFFFALYCKTNFENHHKSKFQI